jgi:hypothetical protein
MASYTYTLRDGTRYIFYTDSKGVMTGYENLGKDGGEPRISGDKVSHSPNTERVGKYIEPNVERHWGLPVDSVGIEWMDNAAKLSIYGFALMGGTHLASKTPMGGLALIGFIGGTVCLVTSCVMYVLCPIPLVASWIANR